MVKGFCDFGECGISFFSRDPNNTVLCVRKLICKKTFFFKTSVEFEKLLKEDHHRKLTRPGFQGRQMFRRGFTRFNLYLS